MCRELGSLDGLAVADRPDPVPGDADVVVDVTAAGLNFPDLLLVQGLYQHRPELPFVPGGEGSGVVAGTGAHVDGVAPGDEVIFVSLTGAFAERAVAAATHVFPKPADMPFDVAAAFAFTYGTSYHALKQRAELEPGETLAVLGASGGVGSAAVELGKAMGATVIACASTDEKLAFARSLGADETVNYSTRELRAALKDLTGGRGVDVVYDPVGGSVTEPALRSTAWAGRYLVIGFAAGEIPKIPLNLPLLKGYSVVGVFWGTWLQREPATARRNMEELTAMYTEGRIAPRVTDIFALEDHREAFRAMQERRATGKVVVQIRD